ncbi:MAG: HD domain-containing protein, partial [Desulfocapsaceae bacterium]|nr:HD domain-containing protein [Desulfocapsaceae bacterium]
LRHTRSVALAAARLFHGLYHEGVAMADDLIIQGMLSAYFHDLGMLPQSSDKKEDAVNYARFHEQRSMMILDDYLDRSNLPVSYRDNCATLIKYTNLDWEGDENGTQNEQLHICGQVVGTADLVAQMADRYYLESLPLLFHEHQDSGIDSYESAIDLMLSTIDFHERIIKKRLRDTLGNMAFSLRSHFRKRFHLDRNLYLERIALNLDYLEMITEDCAMDLRCWSKYLRRNPPEADE